MDDLRYAKPQLLTEINYFGLTINEDGEFVKVVDGETDPGWREWNSEAVKNLIAKSQIMGAKFSFSIISHSNGTIETFLDSQPAQDKLITEIVSEVKTRKLDGVNIDFEYLGDPEDEYRKKFAEFSKKLSGRLKKEAPNTTLAISLMPLAAREKNLFDLSKLSSTYDRFVGMSYDYNNQASIIAGPVAPMKGFKEEKYFFDVATTYEDFLKFIPKEKILMGVPYYGWDWAVEDGKIIQSAVLPSDDPNNYAAVVSYGRMREAKEIKKNQCKWDEYALSTWCWYTKGDVSHQVWLEDNRSIGIKFDFAKEKDLAGVAIWTLGFDRDYPDLWDLIKEKFKK